MPLPMRSSCRDRVRYTPACPARIYRMALTCIGTASDNACVDLGVEIYKERPATAVEASNQKLVQELGAQISVQEKLVEELASKETELARQRVLYEEKLVAIKSEKENLAASYQKMKGQLGGLSGSTGLEAKKLKQQYKAELKAMEQKIKHMAEDGRKRDRELLQNKRAQEQIGVLKENLANSKKERKRLMAEARQKLIDARKDDTKRLKEIAQLKKDGDRKAIEARTLQSDVERKEALVERLRLENQKVKAMLDAGTAGDGGGATGMIFPGLRRSTRLRNKVKKQHRSQGMSMKIAKKDKKFLDDQIQQAVAYAMQKQQAAELIKKRETLAKEVCRCHAEPGLAAFSSVALVWCVYLQALTTLGSRWVHKRRGSLSKLYRTPVSCYHLQRNREPLPCPSQQLRHNNGDNGVHPVPAVAHTPGVYSVDAGARRDDQGSIGRRDRQAGGRGGRAVHRG